jgi:hypothetical protein
MSQQGLLVNPEKALRASKSLLKSANAYTPRVDKLVKLGGVGG